MRTLFSIGVLVTEGPYGPFKNPMGKPPIKYGSEGIDSTVLFDDNGQACLYWGNSNFYYVKLNDDMISFSADIIKDAFVA